MSSKETAPQQGKKRVVGRPFPKGQSGNPKGRKKDDPEVIAILRGAGPDIARRLVELALTCKDPRYALQAMELALNRAYGKPVEQTEMEITGTGGGAVVFQWAE